MMILQIEGEADLDDHLVVLPSGWDGNLIPVQSTSVKGEEGTRIAIENENQLQIEPSSTYIVITYTCR
ncbi:hypothetical protein BDN72DRAFT_837142 [Pluteus cervinus]|uniref:Uncharacterized protein n=1 Tax=Pluteus cervinus TaxID=181527 RepID=A0ACD3B0H2_9AGAR|nr:hypothetical protein BDN72DRAFT_837142 [Pluteus cervinus]